MSKLKDLTICIKSGGDLATGVAVRLFKAGFRRLVLVETEFPLAVRRTVCLSEAVYNGTQVVENVTARRCDDLSELAAIQDAEEIPVLVDPQWLLLPQIKPAVVIDAILAKKNLGTRIDEADLVIGLGPGFSAGRDVHCVVETNRGHFLGSTIYSGSAQENTGIPGVIAGYSIERVLWSPQDGLFTTDHEIGDRVHQGEVFGMVDDTPVFSQLDGVIRGLLRTQTPVRKRTKLGDIDPRGEAGYCRLVSEKSRAIGGGVLEAILHRFMAAEN